MEPFQLKEKEALILTEWQEDILGLVAGFSTKNGGLSKGPYASLNLGLHVKDQTEDVLFNREKLAKVIGIPVGNWVAGEQVHDSEVHRISEKDKGKGSRSTETAIKGADGLVSSDPTILATAFFADCVPLFFVDPVTKWYGIAHAGWKGTVAEIGREMIQSFIAQGSDPKNIKAAVGPSISMDHYEVDGKVMEKVPAAWRDEVHIPKENNKFLLDLKKLNYLILQDAGLLETQISMSSYCTYKNEELFFSHRRDNGHTGRMLGFIGISKQHG